MGVIYHRRDPHEHAARLHALTAPGGQVIVESLVVQDATPLIPADRYARMRNVWWLPTPERLAECVAQAGFIDAQVIDVTPTSPSEQRRTPWMTFDSLAEALDPSDPSRTVEGHPAPVRALVTARRPAN